MAHGLPDSNANQSGWTYTIQSFIRNEAFGGILLLLGAAIAMIWANSAWSDDYFDLLHAKITIGSPEVHISKSLQHWVNDGLMVLFFLLVGMEIKREILVGELASVSRAALPAVAACGGAIVPAIIFAAMNWGTDGVHGWGIPMATDIAFAVGVLALVGSRVPFGLKVFLTALAIVDDLLAVLVIAIFYTDDLNLPALGGAAAVLATLILANRLQVRTLVVYLTLGFALWLFVLQSGIHATVAGVLLAMTIPTNARINPEAFLNRAEGILGRFERESLAQRTVLSDGRLQENIQELEDAVNDVEAPLQNLEHALQRWVSFLIVPIFAIANAGVSLDVDLGEAFTSRITLGVIIGLVVGKQIGITLSAWASVRFGLAALPEGVTWKQIYGVSWIAGIGFTMSLFVAELAYDTEEYLTDAKIGILVASTIAGILGWLVLSKWILDEPEVTATPGRVSGIPDRAETDPGT
jgi:NhaA family Na+:H+ antiporter